MARGRGGGARSTPRGSGAGRSNTYEKYFDKWGSKGNIWNKYKEQVRGAQSNPYAKIADEAVERVVKTIGKYEKFVKKKEREHKREIKSKDDEIKQLLKRIAELEKSNKSKDEQIKKLSAVDKRAQKNFNKVKAKSEASFRGDKMAEKAGEKANASKDTYEKIIEQIITKGKIELTPKRADALARSSGFTRALKLKAYKGEISHQRLEELWALNFGGTSRQRLSQFGLASDIDEDWDYSRGGVYTPKKEWYWG